MVSALSSRSSSAAVIGDPNVDSFNALYDACERGDLDFLKKVQNEHPATISDYGHHALRHAIQYSQKECMQFLIEQLDAPRIGSFCQVWFDPVHLDDPHSVPTQVAFLDALVDSPKFPETVSTSALKARVFLMAAKLKHESCLKMLLEVMAPEDLTLACSESVRVWYGLEALILLLSCFSCPIDSIGKALVSAVSDGYDRNECAQTILSSIRAKEIPDEYIKAAFQKSKDWQDYYLKKNIPSDPKEISLYFAFIEKFPDLGVVS